MNLQVSPTDMLMLIQGRAGHLQMAINNGQIDTAALKAYISGMFMLADQLHEMAEAAKVESGAVSASGGNGGEVRAN